MINDLVKVFINLLKVESFLPEKKKIEWALEAWYQLSQENIIKSFKRCGLKLANDGTVDDFIHRLKKGQPCEAGTLSCQF